MNMREEIRGAMIDCREGEQPGVAKAVFDFDADSPVFKGHFPSRSVLPGVFHLEMMLFSLAEIYEPRREIACIRKAKITSEIGPAMRLHLEVVLEDGAQGCLLRGKTYHGQTLAASVVADLKPAEMK